MTHQKLLLLHPGEMGAAIGARLVEKGASVFWVGTGRSPATRARALQAGLTDAQTLEQGVREASIVLSVCPPHGAIDQAKAVAQAGFTGQYVDANAVSPDTSAQVAEIIQNAGGSFTDGGIIGPPPTGQANTRLYLSGPQATLLASWFDAGALAARSLENQNPYAASALKMCFGGWNKARSALLANLITLASHHGVEQDLRQEWSAMEPTLLRYFDPENKGSVTGNARKAWRWNAEMREIAATLEQAGLPAGFHLAAGEVFDRLATFKDHDSPLSLETLTEQLLHPPAAKREG